MNHELLNILINSNKDIDNQKLMDYVSGKLSAEEKHELEKEMVDSDLLNDAIEGLQKFEDKKELQSFVDQLNNNLTKQLDKKKKRKQKRMLKEQPWVYLSIILILILIIISFLVVKKHLENEKPQPKLMHEKTAKLS